MTDETKNEKTEDQAAVAATSAAGILAEFSSPEKLVEAARLAMALGYTVLDASSPFPVHGLDEAIGMKQSKLQLITIGGAIAGAGTGLLLQWWMVTIDYPEILSGKPYFSLPAFIPIIFELTILFAALSTFIGMLALGGLPKYNHALFGNKRFGRATADKFFLYVDAKDPKFDLVKTADFLDSIGADAVEVVEELD